MALNRYTWRYNLVLKVIFNAIKNQIAFIDNGTKPLKERTRDFITVVSSGQQIRFKKKLPESNEKWSGYWLQIYRCDKDSFSF